MPDVDFIEPLEPFCVSRIFAFGHGFGFYHFFLNRGRGWGLGASILFCANKKRNKFKIIDGCSILMYKSTLL
jgi:hypothetical protein